MNKGINVLSLFDGISCGQIALQRAGIKVGKYYASEIDKYAIQVTQKNYPQTIQLGDVTKWKDWDLDWEGIDLLTAGFSCQSWSFSGKQRGIEDPRGKLAITLSEIFSFIKERNPSLKYLFENVKMKKEYSNYLDNLFGIRHVLVDSSLFSAQNRKRIYWTNLSKPELPEDKGILLKDILEKEVDEKYFITERTLPNLDKDKIKKRLSQYSESEIHQCLVSQYFKDGMVFTDRKKSNTIVAKYQDYGAINYNRDYGQLIFVGTLDNYRARRLTPVECERLQTLPDNYTEGVSNKQRYKTIGNGWTVDVVAHILWW